MRLLKLLTPSLRSFGCSQEEREGLTLNSESMIYMSEIVNILLYNRSYMLDKKYFDNDVGIWSKITSPP